MTSGIYIVANDKVYDQLVALLNSIETNCGKDTPICLIPYDRNIDLVKQEISRRNNMQLFSDDESIAKWEQFITEFQALYHAHPPQGADKGVPQRTNALGMHRRYCAFDGPFEKFIYIDCDTLLFQPVDFIFSMLDEWDFMTHDFQRKTSEKRGEVGHFYERFSDRYPSEAQLLDRFHCSGFWASKRGVISSEDLPHFLQELKSGDIAVFRTDLFEQIILNYMTLKKNLKLYNFTLDQTSDRFTGSCITSRHFEERDHILYDHGKRLTYLHYMGVKNERIQQLCQWRTWHLPDNNVLLSLADKVMKWQISNIPYKEIFLYYRFLT